MATKFITANTNKIAHSLRRAYPQLTWGDAFRMAIAAEGASLRDVMRADSVFGSWHQNSQKKVAEQLCAIGGAYALLGDKGRSRAFGNIGAMLKQASYAGMTGGFADLLAQRGIGMSITLEIIEMFANSRNENLSGEEKLTARVQALRAALYGKFLTATSQREAVMISEAAYKMTAIHWWCCADDLDNEGVLPF